jgi:hypothetical protein
MISFIKVNDKDIKFKTSVLAIRHYAGKKKITFDEALNEIGKCGVEDVVKLFHSSVCTIEGQEAITEDDVWKWIDEDVTLMNDFLKAMMESTPKNLTAPEIGAKK